MAKMFKHSEDADVKQLSIFETPPTNTSVREKHFLNVHPILAITPSSNVIHFLIKGHSLKYCFVVMVSSFQLTNAFSETGYPAFYQ